MSVVVCVKGPEGIVLGADSRQTFGVGDPRVPDATGVRRYITCDNDMKLLSFSARHRWVGFAFYGAWHVFSPMNDLVAEIEAALPSHRVPVAQYAKGISAALARRAALPLPIPFTVSAVVAGYDEGESEGRVYVVEVPGSPEPIEHHPGSVGITYGGARETIDRILLGYDSLLVVEDDDLRKGLLAPLPLSTMPLGECVELATFLIRTSTDLQRFAGRLGLQGSGGPVDVATITADEGLRYVQRKEFDPEGSVTEREYTSARPAIVTDAPADIARLARYTVQS